jgi:multidrug resistance efflux pump
VSLRASADRATRAVVQRLPVRLRLMERPGEPPLRAGMTAYVTIDTGRTRSLASIFGNGAAVAAGCEEGRVIRRAK